MADSSQPTPEPAQAPLPTAPSLSELRLPINQLAKVNAALAGALGEAGIGGQELNGLFAAGVKATCVACGLGLTGTELGELALAASEDHDRRLSPRLEKLRLGECPRNGCESRFYQVVLTAPGRFDRGWVLGRTQQLIAGKREPLLSMRPSLSPETRRTTRRLAGIALATFFVAFVAYRLVFFRSQPIPFVQPKSPFTVEPTSIDPSQR
ncbi:MAG TPA: hypothetical protein PLX89_04720 [Verrucomicrobiota bacterium]|nr:hypothetical protein [Verrucomicrobiales bacterium]HRI12289.1 hypothetical protein [Verrucomicrobiota bacterium]